MKLFYAFLSLVFIAGLAHGQLRIGGSDLLETEFKQALVEYSESRDLDLKIDFGGSYPGLDDLKKGKIDLAIVAIPDGGEIPDGEYRSVHIASKALAVVVPQANPLNQITLRQLAGVFGEAEASNITRWGQLGLTGEWASRSISLGVVSQQEHALALDLFRHSVLQSRNIKRTANQSPGIEGIRLRLQQDNHSIALLHRVPSDLSGMKILPIARSEADLAHGPNLDSIASQDYPLRLPFYLVFPAERAAELRDLLRFMVSEEMARAISANDLAPLSDQRRQALFFEFERL